MHDPKTPQYTVEHTRDEYGQDRWFVTDSAGDWIGDPFESRDAAYIAANAELSFGPRGGIRMSPC